MAGQDEKLKKIGDYVFGKTIGQGTFGKVKLGTHSLTGEKVAIKILVKQKIIDVADVQRVSREIHILKLIRHPSIIQLYEIIQTSKYLFLVMDYVQKGQLFDYIVKQTKINQLQACRFFKFIISGIYYLHELNIVHRDLKPQNLLVDWKKGLKIVDFGLSNTYKNGQTLKTACGSPCYAAPQMISSKKYNGLEVDIWSCGVILFAMVCGYLPFEDSNTSQLYKKILSGQYVLPNFVSDQFRDLLEKILNVDPSKRYKIQQIFAHEWCSQVEDIQLKSGIIIGYHKIPVDKNILSKLKQFDFDLQYAQRCIQANKHNNITTTYYLLLKKYLRQGNQSPADFGSAKFDYLSIEPFKREHNLNKYFFYGSYQQIPFINLQNGDIQINSIFKGVSNNQQKRKQGNLKIKVNVNLNNANSYNRTNNFFQKDKNQLHIINEKKSNDLKMYLNQKSSKKKDFYSEVKRKIQRKSHIQSLRLDSKLNNKDENKFVIRMNTQYSEQRSHNQSKGNAKTKCQKLYAQNKCQNRTKTKNS